MTTFFAMWVVYDHPKDYPEYFIARKWLVNKTGPEATDEVIARSSLNELRDALPPGLYPLPAQVGDDPCIAEVWV